MDERSGWNRFRSHAEEVMLLIAVIAVPVVVAWSCRHETWVAVMIVIDVLGCLGLVLLGRAEGRESALVFPIVIGWVFAIVVKPTLMLISAVHHLLGG